MQHPTWTRPLLALPFLLAGCAGWPSALDPKGPTAADLAWLIQLFTVLLGVIWLLVVLAVGLVVFRRRWTAAAMPMPKAVHPSEERRPTVIVMALVVATCITVLVLTGLSFAGQQRLFGVDEPAVTIQVTGHQWWWEVRYQDGDPSRVFTTANEIHVPVGLSIRLVLESDDVIHSFWVPNLAGKQDLVPGQQNQLGFTVTEPGIYRGQCAEFCGLQHAHMGIIVVAESEPAFRAWQEAQIRPGKLPETAEQRQGMQVFLSHACVMCHAVRGTPAGGRTGPDLTHVGSRRHLAAATLPLTRGSLAAWIADPHGIKPGVNMPIVPLASDELNSLAAYLEGLK
ncbi:MAG TPA: cytochrome c oxidase subunit II [Geminicoccus sp.]|uniref:cytochrome c oxidase subunit II n=1 Tax=Geminicoccus sp. TaxID=2024832 RepID=UPI002CA2CC91|nr:cytochrome c oxidase subunit II [Geminicoccus sp.]HWL69899.1 cytochrome c oxidase subunit II [Geminicoccus sp.]